MTEYDNYATFHMRLLRFGLMCTGEQDQSAYDISQLKKPLNSSYIKRAPTIEKVMPPSIPTMERPRKRGLY